MAAVASNPCLPAPRSEGRRKGALKGWERRRESDDDFVAQNLDPWELALWDREKQNPRFRSGTPHQRLERFRDWMHDNPSAVGAANRADVDAKLEREIRKESRRTEPRPTSSHVELRAPCRKPFRMRYKRKCFGW